MSSTEVAELARPTAHSLQLVHRWLYDHEIRPAELGFSAAKDWVKVSLYVHQVERLLDTKYFVYRHEDGSYLIRTPEWSVPPHLHDHIMAVQPTNAFFHTAPQHNNIKPIMSENGDVLRFNHFGKGELNNMTIAQACNMSAVTPVCSRTLYGTLDYNPQVAGVNKIGLTNYLTEASNRSDTALFLQQFRPEATSAAQTFKTIVVAGGNNQQTPNNASQLAAGKNLEGNLDAETIIGIGYPTPLTTYNTGGSPPFTPDSSTPTNTNDPISLGSSMCWVSQTQTSPR